MDRNKRPQSNLVFLDRTLGVAMPRIQWSSLWPVVLIVLGVLVLLRSFQRNA